MDGAALLVPLFLIFVLAGAVKGVVGLGLPTVSLALLVLVVDLPRAMTLMLLPSLATNLWQGLAGGGLAPVARRLGPLMAAGAVCAWAAAGVLARAEAAPLLALLGVSLALYAAVGLSGWHPPAPGRRETLVGVLVGAVTGVLTGLTGTFVVPAVPYMQSLGLDRDRLIQAMGLWFSVATGALALGLGTHGLMAAQSLGLSALALAPAALGMALGTALRRRLPERAFRRALFLGLLGMGVYLVVKAGLS